jgi:hypothetical protein
MKRLSGGILSCQREMVGKRHPSAEGSSFRASMPSGAATGKGSMRALGLILGTIRAERAYLPYSALFLTTS